MPFLRDGWCGSEFLSSLGDSPSHDPSVEPRKQEGHHSHVLMLGICPLSGSPREKKSTAGRGLRHQHFWSGYHEKTGRQLPPQTHTRPHFHPLGEPRKSVAACLAVFQGKDSNQGHGNLKAIARQLRPRVHSSRQRHRAAPPRSPPTTPTRNCTSFSPCLQLGLQRFPALL